MRKIEHMGIEIREGDEISPKIFPFRAADAIASNGTLTITGKTWVQLTGRRYDVLVNGRMIDSVRSLELFVERKYECRTGVTFVVRYSDQLWYHADELSQGTDNPYVPALAIDPPVSGQPKKILSCILESWVNYDMNAAHGGLAKSKFYNFATLFLDSQNRCNFSGIDTDGLPNTSWARGATLIFKRTGVVTCPVPPGGTQANKLRGWNEVKNTFPGTNVPTLPATGSFVQQPDGYSITDAAGLSFYSNDNDIDTYMFPIPEFVARGMRALSIEYGITGGALPNAINGLVEIQFYA